MSQMNTKINESGWKCSIFYHDVWRSHTNISLLLPVSVCARRGLCSHAESHMVFLIRGKSLKAERCENGNSQKQQLHKQRQTKRRRTWGCLCWSRGGRAALARVSVCLSAFQAGWSVIGQAVSAHQTCCLLRTATDLAQNGFLCREHGSGGSIRAMWRTHQPPDTRSDTGSLISWSELSFLMCGSWFWWWSVRNCFTGNMKQLRMWVKWSMWGFVMAHFSLWHSGNIFYWRGRE